MPLPPVMLTGVGKTIEVAVGKSLTGDIATIESAVTKLAAGELMTMEGIVGNAPPTATGGMYVVGMGGTNWPTELAGMLTAGGWQIVGMAAEHGALANCDAGTLSPIPGTLL